MLFTKKRGEFEILYEMLTAAQKGIKKTRLMYKANLSYTQLIRYLSLLEDEQIIHRKNTPNQGVKYYTTSKGNDLIDPLEKIIYSFK